MFEIAIRPAIEADARPVSALIQRTLRVSNAADYSVAEISRVFTDFTPARVLHRIQRRDVFVAETGGAILGTVGYGEGQLWALFVAPEHQRLGLGTALVDHVEQHARRRGARQLGLSASLTAVDFYEQLGYRRVAYHPQVSGATYAMVKMLV